MVISNHIRIILSELNDVLSSIDSSQVDQFIYSINKAKKIIMYGAGRMGLVMQCFSMRLTHLGFSAYSLTDSNVPAINTSDLLIIASGSGETQTVYDVAVLGKKHGAHLSIITLHKDSRIGKLADTTVEFKLPVIDGTHPLSIQPMKTLVEQALMLLLDAVIMEIMQRIQYKEEDVLKRHSNLE